jgi:hypothetical protein
MHRLLNLKRLARDNPVHRVAMVVRLTTFIQMGYSDARLPSNSDRHRRSIGCRRR